MNIRVLRDALLKRGALKGRVDCSYECFLVKKGLTPTYLILLNDLVTKKNIEEVKEAIIDEVTVKYTNTFPRYLGIIIIAPTTELRKAFRWSDSLSVVGDYALDEPKKWYQFYRRVRQDYYLINEEHQIAYHDFYMNCLKLYLPRKLKAIKMAVGDYLEYVRQNQSIHQ